jgi:hypothetical protein
LLIFEVTARRILNLPINIQQSSIVNRQFFRGSQKRRNPYGTSWFHHLGPVQKSAVRVLHAIAMTAATSSLATSAIPA